jgi:hypothetical protein
MIKKILSLLLLIILIDTSFSQTTTTPPNTKARMTYMGTFDAGQPNVGIFKMYDPTDGVVCYIMTPENVVSKNINNKITYEGNSIGSISCVKILNPPSTNNVNPSSTNIKKTEDNKTKEKPSEKK